MAFRHLAAVALLLAPVLGAPPLAADPTDALARMAGAVPLELMTEGAAPILFADAAAARPVIVAEGTLPPEMAPWMRAPSGLFANMPVEAFAAWPALLGFGLADIERILTLDNPPGQMAVIELAPAAAAGLPAALAAQGYTPVTRPWGAALSRGGEDFSMDFSARNSADPFGGAFGRAARLALTGEVETGQVLTYASAWPWLDAARDDSRPRLGSGTGFTTLMAAVDAAAPAGGQVAWAMVFTPQMIAAEGGFSHGLIADIAAPEDGVTLLVLALDETAEAEPVAAMLRARWQGSDMARGLSAQALVLPGGVVALAFANPEPQAARQPRAQTVLLDALFRGTLGADLLAGL